MALTWLYSRKYGYNVTSFRGLKTRLSPYPGTDSSKASSLENTLSPSDNAQLLSDISYACLIVQNIPKKSQEQLAFQKPFASLSSDITVKVYYTINLDNFSRSTPIQLLNFCRGLLLSY